MRKFCAMHHATNQEKKNFQPDINPIHGYLYILCLNPSPARLITLGGNLQAYVEREEAPPGQK